MTDEKGKIEQTIVRSAPITIEIRKFTENNFVGFLKFPCGKTIDICPARTKPEALQKINRIIRDLFDV